MGELVGGASEQEDTFAVLAADGADLDEASKIAGYNDATILHKLVGRERVQERMKRHRIARIKTDLANASIKVLKELLGAEQPPAVRLGAAKYILDMAGHGPEDGESNKPVGQMSENELVRFMQRQQEVIERGLVPATITVTPDNGALRASDIPASPTKAGRKRT